MEDNERTDILGGLGAERSAEFNFSASTTLNRPVGEHGSYPDEDYFEEGGAGVGGNLVFEDSKP